MARSVTIDVIARDKATLTFKKVGAEADALSRKLDKTSELKTRIKVTTDDKDVDGFGKKLMSKIGPIGKTVGKAFGVSLLAAAAGALGTQGLQLAAALAPAAGAVAAIPALALGAAAALGTLKLATAGLGVAFKALGKSDSAKFDAALEKMAPSARAFAREVKTLYPQLQKLQRAVQQRFFAGLARDLKDLSAVVLPVLKRQLPQVASGFNAIATNMLRAAKSSTVVGALRVVLSGVSSGLTNAAGGAGRLVTALAQIATAGAPLLSQIGTAVGGLANRFATFIDEASKTGKLQGYLAGALGVLKQLAQLGGDVVGVIRGILKAASAVGGNALGGLGTLVHLLNQVVNSAGGQAGLQAVFSALGKAGSALAPVLQAVAGGLVPLARIVADLAVGLGPGLTVAVRGLSKGLSNLAPAAKPVGEAVGSILKAVSPLLPLLGAELANVLTIAAGALKGIATAAAPFLKVLGDVGSRVAKSVLPVIQQLAKQALPVVAKAASKFGDALAPVAPLVGKLATSFVKNLLPYLPQIGREFVKILPAVEKVAGQLGTTLVDALTRLGPQMPSLAKSLGQLAVSGTKLLVALAPLLADIDVIVPKLIDWAVTSGSLTTALKLLSGVLKVAAVGVGLWASAFSFVTSLPGKIKGAFGAIGGFFSGLGRSIGTFFTVTIPGWISSTSTFLSQLPGKILGYLSSLPGKLAALASGALQSMAYAVGYGIGWVVKTALTLPGRILSAIASLPGKLTSLASRTWANVSNAFGTGYHAVINWVSKLPGRIGSLFSSALSGARNIASRGISAVVGFFSALPGRVGSALRSVPGRVSSALSGAIGSAKTIGRQVVQGFINGLSGMIGNLVSEAKSLAHAVVKGFNDALGIGSPSKVLHQIGAFAGQGFVNGLSGTVPLVSAAADRVSAAALFTPPVPALAGAAAGGSSTPAFDVHVHVDDPALKQLIRVEIVQHDRQTTRGARAGAGRLVGR